MKVASALEGFKRVGDSLPQDSNYANLPAFVARCCYIDAEPRGMPEISVCRLLVHDIPLVFASRSIEQLWELADADAVGRRRRRNLALLSCYLHVADWKVAFLNTIF